MRRAAAALLLAPVFAAPTATAAGAQLPGCAPGGPPVTFTGSVAAADARTYRELEFAVADGTTRVEVTYGWTESGPAPAQTATVLDLGLWDPEGFRGWSGSRGGRVSTGQEPVFVQPDVAARGYVPGPIPAGPWFVDLGIANVAPLGATYTATVTCSSPAVGAPFEPDPVDPTHVADAEPGWFYGDFHVHGFHSNSRGPTHEELVDTFRDRGLDFVPLTEYVTGQHWGELGPVQRANPDLVVWPGREIITYFGHAIALGETPSVLEYRHGHDGASLAQIQDATLADGALFQVAHPDFFPPPLASFCRGCYFELGSTIDWSRVDTIEVLTGPVVFAPTDIGLPAGGELLANPFTQPAIDRWESLLRAGYHIAAVSGSDSKGVEPEPDRRGYGSSATAVYASELSRPALADALRAGHAYVRTRGVDDSPEVELTGRAGDQTAMMGDTLVADTAELTVTVRGASGQLLTILRDGEPVGLPLPIDADPFTHSFTATRTPGSGPLGTFWRVDVSDLRSLTAITNPIFLDGEGEAPPLPTAPVTPAAGAVGEPLPRTGTTAGLAAVGVVLAAAGLLLRRTGVRPDR